MRLVMSKYNPEEDIRYCPDWLAANKTGRPKKNQRALGVTNHIQSKTKKRKKKMLCSICNKFNHNTVDCYQNPNNARKQHHLPENNNADEFDDGGGGIGVTVGASGWI